MLLKITVLFTIAYAVIILYESIRYAFGKELLFKHFNGAHWGVNVIVWGFSPVVFLWMAAVLSIIFF